MNNKIDEEEIMNILRSIDFTDYKNDLMDMIRDIDPEFNEEETEGWENFGDECLVYFKSGRIFLYNFHSGKKTEYYREE